MKKICYDFVLFGLMEIRDFFLFGVLVFFLVGKDHLTKEFDIFCDLFFLRIVAVSLLMLTTDTKYSGGYT
jgi:hypothetical protein